MEYLPLLINLLIDLLYKMIIDHSTWINKKLAQLNTSVDVFTKVNYQFIYFRVGTLEYVQLLIDFGLILVIFFFLIIDQIFNKNSIPYAFLPKLYSFNNLSTKWSIFWSVNTQSILKYWDKNHPFIASTRKIHSFFHLFPKTVPWLNRRERTQRYGIYQKINPKIEKIYINSRLPSYLRHNIGDFVQRREIPKCLRSCKYTNSPNLIPRKQENITWRLSFVVELALRVLWIKTITRRFLLFILQSLICEHEIRNIHCACQDSEDLTHFAYITKDRASKTHYCHVFCVQTMVSGTTDVLLFSTFIFSSYTSCIVNLQTRIFLFKFIRVNSADVYFGIFSYSFRIKLSR